jgi:hypothetical protein
MRERSMPIKGILTYSQIMEKEDSINDSTPPKTALYQEHKFNRYTVMNLVEDDEEEIQENHKQLKFKFDEDLV